MRLRLRSLKQLFKRRESQLFSSISGHEDVKWTLQREEPIHILLVGPPGLGKTRFLKVIEKGYPDISYFALGSGATGQGMVSRLFEEQPRYLLIDELEDLRKDYQAVLLSLMQDGELVETKKSSTRSIKLTCSVIATSNDTKKLKGPLLSRFAVIELKAYDTFEEFRRVTLDILNNHPLAEYIAETVYSSSDKPNIRDCVRISKLAQTEQDVLTTIRILKR